MSEIALRDIIAQAICGPPIPWDAYTEGTREHWRTKADAVLTAIRASGWHQVHLPEDVDPAQVEWSWRYKTTARCSWCNNLSTGMAVHNDGTRWPSCGQHGAEFEGEADR